MARRTVHDEQPAPRRRSPAKTPEEWESLLISKAQNLIEKQIDDGTISSTVLAIYAKGGTERDRLEKQRLVNDNAYLEQKVKTMAQAVDIKNLMEDALYAFQGYEGRTRSPVDEDAFDD